jgi:NitT/TauT family transport system substrate-binding protein
LLLRAYLEKHGLDLEKDVNMIAVGYGSQASEALNSGNVDALMLWGAALNQLENLGHSFRYFRDEDWSQMPEFSIATSQDMIDNDYQTVVDIVKGAVMATVFTEANPDCVVTVHWQKWPETKPSDVDDATARAWDLHTLDGTFQGMLNAYRLHGSDRWGVATEEEFARLQTFLHEGGLIAKTLDPTTYFINKPDFWEQVNDFDHEAIRQQALACDF